MGDRLDVQAEFRDTIVTGLATWEEARALGETPSPFHFRIDGAETPPNGIWETITQDGLTELVNPTLIFDLGFYYSESMGIALRYVRYAEFTEAEILPWLGHADETTHFYGDDATLRPEFKGHMDRLAEYGERLKRLRTWEACLLKRLETPQAFSRACREETAFTIQQ